MVVVDEREVKCNLLRHLVVETSWHLVRAHRSVLHLTFLLLELSVFASGGIVEVENAIDEPVLFLVVFV